MADTQTKTLAESYEGMLSRDWDKLLDALDRGEERLLVYSAGLDEVDSPPYTKNNVSKAFKAWRGEAWEVYVIRTGGYIDNFATRYEAKKVLEEHCSGYFPTKEDSPEPTLDEMVEVFNKWIKVDGNLKLFLDSKTGHQPSKLTGEYLDRARAIIEERFGSLGPKDIDGINWNDQYGI